MPALDGVRGLAIAMVLALHFIANTHPTNALERVMQRVFAFGDQGVDLFFVLSGFLITGILYDAKHKESYFKNFYARRALRIFPLYYLVLAAVFFVAPLIPALRGPDLDTVCANQVWAWLYGTNILDALHGAFSMPYLDHFWSLAVEEHFYFFWPLVVWLFPRRTLLVVSIVTAVASFGARAAFAHVHTPPVTLYVLTPFRLDALCVGAFLSLWARGSDGFTRLARVAVPVGVAGLATLVVTYVFNQVTRAFFDELHELRVTSFAVIFGGLVARAVTADADSFVGRAFRAPAARWLGKYSYGLYVFHHFASFYFIRHQTEFTVAGWVGNHTLAVFVQAVAGVVFSIVVAVTSFRFVESRILALKRYWE